MAPGDGSRHFSAYHPYLRSRALCRLWASGSPASFTPLPPCSSSTLRRLSKFAQHVTEVNEPPVPRFSSEPRFLLACRAGKNVALRAMGGPRGMVAVTESAEYAHRIDIPVGVRQ